MEKIKEDIISQLKNVRDDDINKVISPQEQIVLLFELVTDSISINEIMDKVTFITTVFEKCNAEIELVEQQEVSELLNYEMPKTFL